jgi:hypothetical protein
MRVGVSDTKNVVLAADERHHRVILPVYVPRLDGYFENAFEILTLCLDSLRLTTAGRVAVTVIANQCAADVVAWLWERFRHGWIDQLIVNRDNHGRIDAVVSAARGTHEPLLTLADSDVMFADGWLDAIETLLATFPECGMASVVPHPGTAWHHTSATVLSAALMGELDMAKVVSDTDIDRFGRSIGVPQWIKPEQRAQQLIVSRRGLEACVGCPHFLFTIRREVLEWIPREPCLRPLGAGSDELWYDRPPDIGGCWRLATTKAYAYHMGNVPEPWMTEELARLEQRLPVSSPAPAQLPPLRRPPVARVPWRLRVMLAAMLRRAWLHSVLRRTAAVALETR